MTSQIGQNLKQSIQALLEHLLLSTKDQPQNLLDMDQGRSIHLMVRLSTIPTLKKSPKPIQVHLPHAIYKDTSNLVLIVKPNTKQTDEPNFVMEAKSISLQTFDLKQFKDQIAFPLQKKQWIANFDLIFCDTRIVDKLPILLGRQAFKTKKLPLPIRIKNGNPMQQIRRAIHSTWIHIPKGPSLAIRIGWSQMTPEQLVENAKAVLSVIQDILYQKFQSTILSLHIQSSNSVAIPVFFHDSIMPTDTHPISSNT